MKILTQFALLTSLGMVTFGATPYYAVSDMNSFSWSDWTLVSFPNTLHLGNTNGGQYGIRSAYPGGTMLSALTAPGSANNYQVRLKIRCDCNSSTPIYMKPAILLRANSTASLHSPQGGTFYAVQFDQTAVLVSKRVSGSMYTVGSYTYPGGYELTDGAVLSAYVVGSRIGVRIQGVGEMTFTDSSISTGQPGVALSPPLGGQPYTVISELYLDPGDSTAPSSINPNNIKWSSFPTRVDVQWSGLADDANGSGIRYINVSRGGSQIGSTYENTFSDNTVAASTSYNYALQACDWFDNCTSGNFSVTTPPTGTVDTRQVGLKSTGAFWGAKGEQINLLSGNLNYSIPLLVAQARGGWSLPIGISYNSQNWRQDPAGVWKLSNDVGYGFGWKLQAGALTPYWSNYFTLHHYTFTDATGAEYRLDQVSSGVWSARDGSYVRYDSNTQRLYFTDGSFWVMGSISASEEGDAGSRYPTLIQDTNGNQIIIKYQAGAPSSSPDTSSRITEIRDVRAVDVGGGVRRTYQFNYTSGYLTSITNTIGTSEGYTFTYSSAQTLTNPFTGATFGTVKVLQSITTTATSLTQSFTTDTTGSLTKVTFPYGGYIRWQHANYAYNGSRSQPEVQNRYLSADGTTEGTFAITRDSSDNTRTVHNYAAVSDPSGTSDKRWFFDTTTAGKIGLLLYREDRDLSGTPVVKVRQDYTWNTTNNPYVSYLKTTTDPGTGNENYKRLNYSVTSDGNLSEVFTYKFNTTSTIFQRVEMGYLSDSNYTSRFIRNRPAWTRTSGINPATGYWDSNPITTAEYYYDNSAPSPCTSYGNTIPSVSGALEHDDTNYGTSFFYRGNLTAVATLTSTNCAKYDMLGNSTSALDSQNRVLNTTYSSSENYAVPTGASMGVYSQSAQWNDFLGLTQQTGLNGSTDLEYDSAGRPDEVTNADGVVTTYTYNSSPAWVMATTNGRYTKTYLDGLGRVTKVESGDGSGIKSVAETEYTYGALSPLGVTQRTSLPHANGTSARWTTYTYDAIGRTLSVQSADGASATTYSYVKNTVTVTDPASKWKKFTVDELGRIAKLTEPNPAGGTWDTDYKYSRIGQVIEVKQVRGANTQTRSFTYTGGFMTQSTTPEKGTTSYYYDAYGRPSYFVDANGQTTTLTYDSLGRITQRSSSVGGSCGVAGDVFYTWDALPGGSGYPGTLENLTGRVARVYWRFCNSAESFRTEFYSYTSTGKLKMKEHYRGGPTFSGGSYNNGKALRAELTYDSEGRVNTLKYPDTSAGTGPTYVYCYDSMGRLNVMKQGGTCSSGGTTLVNNVTYGPAGELLTMTYGGYNETRSYNILYQLTRLTDTPTGGGSAVLDFEYTFPSSTNNGKITKMKDWVTGEEVNYQYDALNRLTSAETTSSAWGQSYTFDGFNNLLTQTVTKGTSFNYSVSVDAATNRLTAHSYDSNGNDLSFGTYDGFNRLATSNGAYYGYDPANKRVWKKRPDGVEEFTFYLGDQRLGTYTYNTSPVSFTALTTNLYFGGKPISRGGSATLTDRLGSDVTGGKRYFPWGQEYSATSNNTEKFATYYRDTESGLDYADQRYHGAGTGRFITPDPIGDGSNWYSYGGGDPVNSNDPRGLCVRRNVATGAVIEDDGNGSACDSITVSATAGDGGMLTFTDPNTIRMLIGIGWQGDIPPGIFSAGCSEGSQPQFCPPTEELVPVCHDWEKQFEYGCDVELNPFAQRVRQLVREMNPAGFVNGVAAMIVGDAAVGSAIASLTAAMGPGTVVGDVIVLGKLPAYKVLAEEIGADYLYMSKDVWAAVGTVEQQWAVNVAFLRAAVSNGSVIRLASDARFELDKWTGKADPSFFFREITYFLQEGYRIADDGLSLLPPPPYLP